jgi:2,3-bisphosphoglycerate-independent phosphoglycerate mutase
VAEIIRQVLIMQQRCTVMLVVLDGWGWRQDPLNNAVRQAHTPTFDRLWESCPHALLRASGEDVGLPQGQMGNSEVGHLNIGAGRKVLQDLPRINAAIADGEIGTAPALVAFIKRLRQTSGTCHLLGLASPGGVHSHQEHAVALAGILAEAKIPTLVHAFTDGRDTPPRSAHQHISRLIQRLPVSTPIATLSGRYYAMDRDNRWDRVQKAYSAIAVADGPRFVDAGAVIANAYAHEIGDEFLPPAVIGVYRGMREGDGLLCFNFRADRVREILTALVDPEFAGFERRCMARIATAVGMIQYGDHLDTLMGAVFRRQKLTNVLGQVVADAGCTQLRIAETEKYAHVTYFLDGGEEIQFRGEDRVLVPSLKVATYDLKPEMSAPELTDKAVFAIVSGRYDLIVLNYANPDMLGHTGKLFAAIKAVEAVDAGLGRLVEAIRSVGGILLVTADHGNCEMMRDPQTGEPHTTHTTNPVPVLLIDGGDRALTDGRLADVAPTLIELLGLTKPAEMTGVSLLRPHAASGARQ